jgi:hypothetical protein
MSRVARAKRKYPKQMATTVGETVAQPSVAIAQRFDLAFGDVWLRSDFDKYVSDSKPTKKRCSN